MVLNEFEMLCSAMVLSVFIFGRTLRMKYFGVDIGIFLNNTNRDVSIGCIVSSLVGNNFDSLLVAKMISFIYIGNNGGTESKHSV